MIAFLLDRDSYRVGSTVRMRIVADTACTELAVALTASVSRDDELVATIKRLATLDPNLGFTDLWQIPRSALTGRYRLHIEVRQPDSGELIGSPSDFSFAVWQAEISISSFSSDRRFYTPGDPIEFRLTLANETLREARDLSIEIGEAQYPWIAAEETNILSETVDLAPREVKTVFFQGRIPDSGAEYGTLQYTAVIRSKRTDQIAAFRSTSPIFLRSQREALRPVYPATYIHADLSRVRTSGYRDFYSTRPQSGGVFDLARTSFRAHEPNQIDLRITENRTLLELRSESGELIDSGEAYRHASSSRAVLHFAKPGLYTLTARSQDTYGKDQRTESVQVSANELPRSLAIVCAHPDDEFLHPAAIRAAVENDVPVHLIFLTCGDAGGSDRFFGVDYTPAEAIEFGHIRIAEARAAARHLGVPESHLHFLGLPDGFLELIRTEARGWKPVFAPLLGTEYAPYRELVQPNLPFHRRPVLAALTKLLSRIDPDTVYTSHPDERHADHKAAGWFTIEALKSLLAAGKLTSMPSLRTDQFYGSLESSPAPFSYQDHELYASGEAMARVQEAYWFYQSQGGNQARGHVLNFADLPRIERHTEILDWAARAEPADLQLPEAV
ncbi:MAG TPA: PIG-L family deacetylase [Bryobacteraceae bacterium]|jgi:LmbE family N-acetylglucosaminyl deacetylase|nr:PIG-L family deacetylase [Bryobacteraceae bacterium]